MTIDLYMLSTRYTGLDAICRADWLSQNNGVGVDGGMPMSLNKYDSQVISHVVLVISRYSTSADERDTP